MPDTPEQEQPRRPDLRRILLTILGGISLTFCSWMAFITFPEPGIAESVARVTYGSFFLTGLILLFGGFAQAAGFIYRKIKRAS